MKRLLITIILFFFGSFSLHAQEASFWEKVNHFLTKPTLVDTTHIYQPSPCFSLGLFTTGQKAGFDVDANFMIDLGNDDRITGLSQYSLSENLCKKIGLEVGYGNIGLGYSLEVGPRSAWKKSSLGLGIMGKSWGAKFNYFKISNPFISSLTLGQESD